MDFPRYHKEIVGDLLDGKFVLATDAKFIELKNNADFYGKFFKETFDFYLDIKSDYAYLISEETMEMLSRDICIFIGLLCYELDKEGKNFLDEISYIKTLKEQIKTLKEDISYMTPTEEQAENYSSLLIQKNSFLIKLEEMKNSVIEKDETIKKLQILLY